jgi:phosphoribosylformylglycinamidine synthase
MQQYFWGFWPNAFAKIPELNQTIFTIDIAAILDIDDIAAYNKQEGLSLSPEEVEWIT